MTSNSSKRHWALAGGTRKSGASHLGLAAAAVGAGRAPWSIQVFSQFNLGIGERIAAKGHLRFGLACDAGYQQAGGRVTRLYGCTAAAAVQGIRVSGQREATGAFLCAMAGQAALGKDGMNLLIEINERRGGMANAADRWQSATERRINKEKCASFAAGVGSPESLFLAIGGQQGMNHLGPEFIILVWS